MNLLRRLGRRLGPLSIIGAVLIVATPIAGLIPFAVGSIIFGESNLEGENGMTALGGAAYLLPAAVGLGLVVIDLVSGPTSTAIFDALTTARLRWVALAAAALGVVLLGLGVFSVVTSGAGDANIGGGLLVMVAVVILVPAVVLFVVSATARTKG